jgi:hypothetical protein
MTGEFKHLKTQSSVQALVHTTLHTRRENICFELITDCVVVMVLREAKSLTVDANMRLLSLLVRVTLLLHCVLQQNHELHCTPTA